MRATGLLLLLLSILFTGYALNTFRRRSKLLSARSGDGFDDAVAPVSLTAVLVTALAIVYAAFVFGGRAIKV